MASKSITRKISIYINGKEVKNNLNEVGGAIGKLRGQLKNLTPGTEEFIKKSQELKKAKTAYKNINDEIRGTDSLLTKIKKSAGAVGFPVAGAMLFTDALKSVVSGAKQYVTEAIQMSIESKGVEYAFKALGDEGEDAFQRVKASTRGLLSDLEIKRSLVEFDNFNISLDESATLFEFLTVRATQTGQSVDYLKQSLVEGLSKESKLRIDNLGISAKALNTELEQTPNFVSAVANIAKTEIAKAGTILDDAASSSQKWNVILENTKLRVGNLVNNSGAITFFQKLGTSILKSVIPAEDLTVAVKDQQTELNVLAQKITGVNTSQEDRIKNINILKAKYPGFLGNLATEKVTNEGIRAKLAEVNKGYVAKIALMKLSQQAEEKGTEAGEKMATSFNLMDAAQIKLNKTLGEAETNRLLENNTVEEATKLALINAGVTKEVEEDVAKYDAKGIETLNKKQRALLEIKSSLGQANNQQVLANGLSAEAAELQEKVNRFTAQYASALKTVDDINPDIDPTPTPDENTEGEESELTSEDKKILASKKKLAEFLAAFDEEQKILKQVEDLEESEAAEEAEVLRLENKYLKMAEDAGFETALEAGLEDAKQAEIDVVREKWAEKFKKDYTKNKADELAADKNLKDKLIAAELNLENAKKAALFSGVSTLKNVFGQKTAVYKLLFGLEKALAINDVLVSNAKANALLVSNEAMIPAILPPGIPNPMKAVSLATTAASKTANNLNTGVQVAAILASALQGFKTGGYTGYGSVDDIAGVTHKNEYVVPEFITQDATYAPILNTLEAKRTSELGVENSLPTTDTTTSNQTNEMLTSAVYALISKLNDPIYSTTLIGDSDIAKFKKRQNKLTQNRENAKIN